MESQQKSQTTASFHSTAQLLKIQSIVPDLDPESRADPRVKQEIFRLQREQNAVILAHNYQVPQIYEIADFIGDSLGLSKAAGKTDSEVIVFCGVHFMAESAAILNPDKTVLLPRLDAGCGMADMITARGLRKMKKQYPDAVVVCYVNSAADVKAESDICCTSTNVIDVLKSLPERQILMVPDKNLANYVRPFFPDKEILAWEGWCPIHHDLKVNNLLKLKEEHPDAELLVHPECQTDMLEHADQITSTQGMIDYAKLSSSKNFIIVTECGMTNRLRREMPGKKFISICQICPDMKRIDLNSVKEALEKMQYKITVPKNVARKARVTLERMMAIQAAGKP